MKLLVYRTIEQITFDLPLLFGLIISSSNLLIEKTRVFLTSDTVRCLSYFFD